MKKISCLLVILFLTPFLWNCAAVSSIPQKAMPSEGHSSVSQWKDYQSALNSFEKIKAGKTLEDLKELRWDPYTTPKTTFLNSLTVRNILLGTGTNTPSKFEDLPKDIQDYLRDLNSCWGLRFKQEVTNTKGQGSLMKRWFKFQKEDLTIGWQFEVLIFMKKNAVAYFYWEGTPNIKDLQFKKDPLGFFSDILGNITGLVIKAIP